MQLSFFFFSFFLLDKKPLHEIKPQSKLFFLLRISFVLIFAALLLYLFRRKWNCSSYERSRALGGRFLLVGFGVTYQRLKWKINMHAPPLVQIKSLL